MTVVPGGLGSSLGAIAEETFGTYKAPTAFYVYSSETLSRQQNYITSTGLRANRLTPLAGLHMQTTRSASGDITMMVPNKGFSKFLNLLHGNTVTPEKLEEGTAYKHLHKIGENAPTGKSLTIQVAKPDVEGTAEPFSYIGAKLTELGLSCATGGELSATLGIWARDEVTAEGLAAVSYPTELKTFTFIQGKVTVAADSMPIVGSFELKIPVAQKLDRYGLAATALAAEPLPNEYFKPTGSLTAEFKTLTQYKHFTETDSAKVVAEFVGSKIGAKEAKETFKVTMPACHFVGSSPQVSGPDILEIPCPFEVYDNATEPPVSIEYISTDSAV